MAETRRQPETGQPGARQPDLAAWPEDARALWQRIAAHALDVPGDVFPFTARLARDNAWASEFAARAVDEYRRFVFLAGVADTPVTPSDQVDQVWHLHLLYTRDYWQVFCPQVLGFELHHGPTRGGAGQRETFLEQYSRTRFLYRQWFGAHPPADVWPPADSRFGRDTRWVRVNLDDVELLPRDRRERPAMISTLLRLPRRLLGAGPRLVLVLLASTPGLLAQAASRRSARPADPRPSSLVDAGFDLYALSAQAFLAWFAVLLAALILAVTLFGRWSYRSRARGRGLGAEPEDVFETAMLAGGESRALLTGVAWLVDRGFARVTGNRLVVETLPPDDAPALVRCVAGRKPGKLRAHKVMRGSGCSAALRQLRATLEVRELLLPDDARPRWTLWLLLLAPAALALPRIAAAQAAGRPFGFVVLLALAATLVGAALHHALIGGASRLTDGGREALARLEPLRDEPVERLPDGHVAAAAMFGAGMLIGTELGDLHGFATAGMRSAASGGDAGHTGCGGGGCGGGGCGGGGCGG
ncbi:MAG: TIGR04222 domain-containing membrane protein [Planctomycetes bacterium]|nr:TIGR04222 domain-containing membrane protein [Planctomycetota bacterium]